MEKRYFYRFMLNYDEETAKDFKNFQAVCKTSGRSATWVLKNFIKNYKGE